MVITCSKTRTSMREARGPSGSGWLAGAAAATVMVAGSFLYLMIAPAADAATLTVCAHGCGYTQIQPAIDAAAPGDTINVSAGTYVGGVVIGTSLTLSGTGATTTTISGGGPVVTVTAQSVTISGFSVVDGQATSTQGGGGILNTGSLTIKNVRIAGNTSEYFGGGVANYGTLTLRNVSLLANTSQSFGGGGIFNDTGAVNMVGDTVQANSAPGSLGGGLYNSYGTATVSKSTFTANTAADGGAIASAQTLLSLKVAGSSLADNAATDGGGGIYVQGLVHHGNGVFTLTASTVKANTAPTGAGLDISDAVTATAHDDQINANTASGDGGGVYLEASSTVAFNATTSIQDNTATSGGGLFNDGGTFHLNGAVVANNHPDNCAPAAC
jgi:predicted outer membrane repeat protein